MHEMGGEIHQRGALRDAVSAAIFSLLAIFFQSRSAFACVVSECDVR